MTLEVLMAVGGLLLLMCVFANRILLEKTVASLSEENFDVYINKFVPSGDSGISLGQAYYGLLKEV